VRALGHATRIAEWQEFVDLAKFRVQEILLVSSLYDSFTLAEDGRLNELVLTEFLDLNLRHPPTLTRVSTGAEALARAPGGRYDLVISSLHVSDMDALTLARRLRDENVETPVAVLAYDARAVADFVAAHDASGLAGVFLWQGDVRIVPAIVKLVEDRINIGHDTGDLGVQAILVIEDNIRFYSSFLPVIYAELMNHALRLVPEGINLAHKLMRLQARPKILLCSTFEDAWRHFVQYEENVLGVISDIEFPMHGALSPDAGVEFARRVRARQADVPVMLQSSRRQNEAVAQSVGASFLLKDSPTLLHDLRRFMIDHFGFGDFIFRTPDGAEVARANDLKMLEEKLRTVPAESVAYHAERNHFSKWLKARTEFALAHSLRPRKVSDYPTIEGLRQDVIGSIQSYRERRSRGVIADFDRNAFDPASGFSRIGGGSLGGKARGLGFVNYLLTEHQVRDRFADVRITVPPSVVIGTDVFDEFLETNDLRDFAGNASDEQEIGRRFLASDLPDAVARDLVSFLEIIRYPIAVRSSSLLEDSQYQPFAGVYETHMLSNSHPEAKVRLRQLVGAIKRVYASMFTARAQAYLHTTSYRLEEEKMAVILQKVVGAAHGSRFYPGIAGVARSHNFYPIPPMRAGDGIVAVALGFGETVMTGRPCVRFCPSYPHHPVQATTVRDTLESSQREFYALPLHDGAVDVETAPAGELRLFDLAEAEADGTLAAVGSTYSPENDVIYDGISRRGVRLVTFAPILKHRLLPLADIVDYLLRISAEGTSAPVEIEFAIALDPSRRTVSEFGFLQLRPLALSREAAALQFGDTDPAELVCQSGSVLGNGRLEIRDLVVVDFHRFDRGKSQDVARGVARFNAEFVRRGVPYALIGVGRWGSSEPFLGIPVSWDEIAGARAIVEAGFRDFRVTPSQGTHFFQNLTASSVGYFTVNPEAGEGFVDWDWLAAQPAVRETTFVRHLHFMDPVVVKMNGRTQRGVIMKPGSR
jgi:CheY-like chemotaxis protein